MSIARKSTVDATSQVAVIFLSLVAGIFVSRILGSEGRGPYMLATSLANATLINLSNLGIGLSSQVLVAKTRERLGQLHTIVVAACLLIGGFVAALLIGAAPWVQASLLKGIPSDHLLIVAATFPFVLYHVAWRGLIIGLGAIKQRALFEVAYGFLQSSAIIVILLGVGGMPILPLIIAYYGIAMIGTVTMMTVLSRQGRLFARPDWKLARELIGYGKWVYVGNMAGSLRQQIDQLLVNAFGGAAIFAVYNQAASLANRGMILGSALEAASYQPITGSEHAEAARLTAAAFRQMLLIGIVMVIGGFIVSPLIPLIYGSDFAGSVWPFRLLVVGIAAIGCARMIAIYFSGHLVRPQIPMIINWIALPVQVGLCFYLADVWGPVKGVTVGTLAGYFTTTALFIALFLRRPEAPSASELFLLRGEDFARWLRLIPGRQSKG
ncbi:oligosaccharide flippase family protein [bacterium]|nr:oligosaccharide flippase family protein [bacterium]